MLYLLDFPPSSLPPNVGKPPYVVFGIRGDDISAILPPKIPLSLVLHFAPKLQQWVLPPLSTTQLPPSVAHLSLCTPHIGLNIDCDGIEADGLKWIINRMMQTGGITYQKSLFLLHPTTTISLSIHKTWLALDLPIGGIANLNAHIHTLLTMGPAITLPEMKAIWATFPHEPGIVRAMGLNYTRLHLDFYYSQRQFSEIRNWYHQTKERYQFFHALEEATPGFGAVQEVKLKTAAANQHAVVAHKKAMAKKKVGRRVLARGWRRACKNSEGRRSMNAMIGLITLSGVYVFCGYHSNEKRKRRTRQCEPQTVSCMYRVTGIYPKLERNYS
jgi:hypothetical protein